MFLQLEMFFSRHKQKIILILLTVIVIALIIAAVCVLSFWKKGSYKTTTFYSKDKSISLTIEDNLELDILNNNTSEHDLLLTSVSNNNTIAVSKTKKNPVYSANDFVNADKSNYASEFENSINISDISQGKVSGYTYYKYSFETDTSFIEVYWITTNDYYYVIDFACDKNSSIDLKSNITKILDTINIDTTLIKDNQTNTTSTFTTNTNTNTNLNVN